MRYAGAHASLLTSRPLGCDTFVAYPPSAPPGTVIFGKNSDRPAGEGQSITRYPAKTYHDDDTKVSCTYIDIPQARQTHAVLLSQIDWMRGAEMGTNSFGVVIGNEAVWTKVPIDENERALLGMDLVRLGLERGKTSREALDVMTTLLEEHGQGGPCGENNPGFTYHNSYLICDVNEGWILETAGKQWAAERFDSGCRNISNGLTIRTSFDLCSSNLKQYARDNNLWDGKGEFDIAKCFSDGTLDCEMKESRLSCGAALMKSYASGTLDAESMMEILRSHEGGICMHGGFETTSAMVSEVKRDNESKNGIVARHWMTGKPHPCKSEFVLQKPI